MGLIPDSLERRKRESPKAPKTVHPHKGKVGAQYKLTLDNGNVVTMNKPEIRRA